MSKRKDRNDLSKLTQSLKDNRSPRAPMQTVRPTRKKTKEQEVPFNLRLPKSLVKRVKIFAVEEETTQKQVVMDALEAYLNALEGEEPSEEAYTEAEEE